MSPNGPATSSAKVIALAVCGLLLLILTVFGLYRQERDDISGFVSVALAQGAVYLAAATLVWRSLRSRQILGLILAVAAVMRLVVLFAPPYLSSDIYRYI